MSENIKEINFIKQVERTAKRDAYLTAIGYIRHFGLESGLRILQEKANSHSVYLASLPLAYDYSTQSLAVKESTIDGNLLAAAMSDLMNTVTAEEKDEKK